MDPGNERALKIVQELVEKLRYQPARQAVEAMLWGTVGSFTAISSVMKELCEDRIPQDDREWKLVCERVRKHGLRLDQPELPFRVPKEGRDVSRLLLELFEAWGE